jgi:hypothetical protein
MLDLTRYGNDWPLGSPLFIVAMPIPSPSTGSSALSHAIKRPQHRASLRPVYFHFWCSDQSNMQAFDGKPASEPFCSWKHWFARALMADPINSARSSSQCTTLWLSCALNGSSTCGVHVAWCECAGADNSCGRPPFGPSMAISFPETPHTVSPSHDGSVPNVIHHDLSDSFLMHCPGLLQRVHHADDDDGNAKHAITLRSFHDTFF